MNAELVALSRFLSYVLRHHPEEIGITLDTAGWVDVDTLLAALHDHGQSTDRSTLERLAFTGTDKRRLELIGDRIRAAQGHTVAVDLQLPPQTPPDLLYHGTVARSLNAIRVNGLRPQGRHHVHLSASQQEAAIVGQRRGAPVVLTIDAAGMHAAGLLFFRAAHGVWLTASVPPRWIVAEASWPRPEHPSDVRT